MTPKHLSPLTKTVRIGLRPSEAFERFTGDMTSWWPLSRHSVGQERAKRVEFGQEIGAPIVEHMNDGASAVWGSVLDWDPPSRIVFTWHPDREAVTAQTIQVLFREADGGTEVQLIHAGWEALGDTAADQRAGYDPGWDYVLGLFASLEPRK